MTGAAKFALGDPDGEHCVVSVVSRAFPGGGRVAMDGNTLSVDLAVRGGADPWRSSAFLRAGDFADFARQLDQVGRGSADVAALSPRDPWLTARLARTTAGDRELEVCVREASGARVARLRQAIDEDALRTLGTAVADVVAAFPELR